MDRALDDVISDRQRGGFRGRRGRRDNEYPRDGVRKSSQRDESRNLDRDWVHDRFEDDDSARRPTRNFRSDRGDRSDRRSPETRDSQNGHKIRVDNLHYDLTEDDITELFERIGPVESAHILYDRSDRSKGTAFVTYRSIADARYAIREFDGANAHGQPIRLELVTTQSRPAARNPFDSVQRPSRSLFDRIEGSRDRSLSPGREGRRSNVNRPAPANIDRYVPGEDGGRRRSPPRRGRDGGRRPGERRGGRGGGRGGRAEDSGRQVVQGRPRKTAEELDAEMEDYFGQNRDESGMAAGAPASGMVGGGQTGGAAANPGDNAPGALNTADNDIDMVVE
ncbi:uncharacterized protein K452DRAFT_290189 [Aplosporella prunicola CBS 121167]|uniref:RRM domain-containing protein n=1 Tax=Aplosporella prunicola CBS 121167 TaxID=1176127 RepID=A0A6A6B9D9_9PEZI|nr:uncharacterized protein K452DRAFT_290189 [Aplosporella prunicola CBS 121167]KAF2139091.1 hypothetical protein K452DRAFT_290189 [Aplosporella prunicola CBS 121167]